MKYKYVVIGAGAAGLVVAIGLAKAKKKVLLIEKSSFGGDCTNFGCIPSKSLIASAKIAHDIKRAKEFGIDLTYQKIYTTDVMPRVREIIEKVRSHEDETALKKMGLDTLKATASFKSPNIIEAIEDNGKTHSIHAKIIIIATGTSPFIPPIEGLNKTPFLTNETVFNLKEVPQDLIIVGAGAIGCELGQAFQRLGSKVKIIDISSRVMPNESSKASETIQNVFTKEHIDLFLDHSIQRVSFDTQTFSVFTKDKSNASSTLQSKHLLIATGRRPNIENLKLDRADIKYTNKGIITDCFSRCNQKHIFAIGDIVGPYYFTHVAEHQARSVLFTLLVPFFKRKKDIKHLPKVTFTDPEVASIGLTKDQASKKYSEKHITEIIVPIKELDRAITQNEEDGFISIITKKYSSEILGATIVASRAAEMLSEIYLAMNKNIHLSSLSKIVHPYPTFNLGIRKAADLWLMSIIKRK